LISLIAALGGAVGTLAFMYQSGNPTIVGLFSPASATSTATLTTSPEVSPSELPPSIATTTVTPVPIWTVCTGLEDGHLNVRAKAGSTAPVLGALSEAVSITPAGQRNGDWLEISAPLAGWVHSRFLCGGSP
jgi:hypothetical protein